jgi:NIPSNAP
VRRVTTTSDPESVLELRQYTLVPGRRDDLVALFDTHFLESQDAVGGRVLGQFRDLDDADRFVWVRAFADMASRQRALEGFYGGPVWAAHRDAANATMVDSDDVLLLRPAEGSGFRTAGLVRAPADDTSGGAGAAPVTVVHVTVVEVPAGAESDLIAWWTGQVEPAVRAAGGRPLGCLVTEPAANTFPALPVREDEHVLVGFVAYDDDAAVDRPEPSFGRVLQHLRLAPTARSLLR